MSLPEPSLIPGNASLPQEYPASRIGSNERGAWEYAPSSGSYLEPGSQGFNLTSFLQSLRRQWLLATGIGIVVMVAAGVVTWLAIGPLYTAQAYFIISKEEPTIMTQSQRLLPEEFEILKNSQKEYLTSTWVLRPVLRDNTEINQLEVIKREKDPLQWLSHKLSVSFPGRAEYMEVSLSLPSAMDAVKILSAVVESYRNEVVDKQRQERQKRLEELDRVFKDATGEVRSLRSKLRNMADRFSGAADPEAFALRQRLTLEQYAASRQQLMQSDVQVSQLNVDLASQRALREAEANRMPTDNEIKNYALQDVELRRLDEEIALKKILDEDVRTKIAPGSTNPVAEGYLREQERTNRRFEEKMNTLREELHNKNLTEIDNTIKKLEASLTQSQTRQNQLVKDTEQLKEQAEQLGSSSIEVEMYRTDLKNKEMTLQNISAEQQKLAAEQMAPSRITLVEKPSKDNLPILPSNFLTRIVLTVFSLMVGLSLSAAGVGFWDMQKRRISTVRDVTDRLGLPVIGTVPMIPARVLHQMGSPTKRNQTWLVRLTESVDGIAARLLRRGETDQQRVVMVTSALSGEGKTTLAAQIAFSLARSGRRTILVDFDLRQPAFDEIFNVPRSPGVSEILRNEQDLAGAIRETGTPNLSLMTAGQWNRATMAALANSAAASLFKELRQDFDFVIIDTSPILPVADARFVSQNVDSTVLCVFRDISEIPRLQAACEILQAFGVHTIEAIVTGANEHLYGRQSVEPHDELMESAEAVG
jgi:polysaccharide biosynthesis transport protein